MTADKKLWRNRKERKEWTLRLQSEDPVLEVVHPHAAGGSMWAIARNTSRYGRTENRNQYAGLSVLSGGLITELWSQDGGHTVDRGVYWIPFIQNAVDGIQQIPMVLR